VENLAFARNGAVLVIQTKEGAVRLRDIDAGVTSGVIWSGDGAPVNEPWYDENTDSVWVASRDRIVQLALGREAWRERACQKAGRDLSIEEWDRLVPGDGPPVQACSDSVSASDPSL
jgi:hypothetical protein